MKNKITDLRNHLFEQMERLNDDKLSPKQLETEINRAHALANLGRVIVDSAKTQVLAAKTLGQGKVLPGITEDAEDFTESIERPKAEYDNSGHLKALKKYA
jgi:hypothetical protein